jgi:tetratricopeptide (TPR) repeat protein
MERRYRHLSLEERDRITEMRAPGDGLGEIAEALGPDHPAVGVSLNNLAALYKDQGQYAQAEPLYKRSLAILEKTTPNHPYVAGILNNLSGLYMKMGEKEKAIPLINRARKIGLGL